jgi:hypothetical protein
MNFEAQLLSELSRKNIDYIIHVVGDNQELFDEILSLMLLNKNPLSPRAAWVLEGSCLKHPFLIQSHLGKIIRDLKTYTHPGTQRNVLKILSRSEIPEKWEGFITDVSFEWLSDPSRPVAIKMYCMVILTNMLTKYPELKDELRVVIENQLHTGSPGFKSRGRKVLSIIKN